MKRYFEVGFNTGDYTSVNVIFSDGDNAEKAARATAEKHAEKYGYQISYVVEVSQHDAESKAKKGMPVYAADPVDPVDPVDPEQESIQAEKETADDVKRAANDKRLEKMRDNLSRMEKMAADLIDKGDGMTAADRLKLLSLVNVAYHGSGKIAGCFSIDSSAACDFCSKMRAAAGNDDLIICGACYAAADSWKEAAWRRHKLNAAILSSVLFTVDELRNLAIPGLLCRFNEDGDTVNPIMARNYLRIAAAHKTTRFGYWFKNIAAVDDGLKAEGFTTRDSLPENVSFVQSSFLIGFPAKPVWFSDAVFTVYPDRETTAAAIAAGASAALADIAAIIPGISDRLCRLLRSSAVIKPAALKLWPRIRPARPGSARKTGSQGRPEYVRPADVQLYDYTIHTKNRRIKNNGKHQLHYRGISHRKR